MRNAIYRILQALVLLAVAASFAQAGDHNFMHFKKKAAGGVGGLIVTDDFNRADGALGANWSSIYGGATFGMKIVSNAAVPDNTSTTDAESYAYYNNGTFSNDQYSKGKISTPEKTAYLIARCKTDAKTFYLVRITGANTLFRKYVNGTRSDIGTATSTTVSVGDTALFSVVGTTLEVKINGTSIATNTDNAIASGQPGMGAYFSNATGVSNIDDFEAGDI